MPFAATVPASSIKLLPGAIIDPLEVNDPEAGRVARTPCMTPMFESKLPEAFSVATPVLTSPTETADVEEKGFSLKLWKPNISSA